MLIGESSAVYIEEQSSDIWIRLGAPSDLRNFAVPLSEEEILVIVNPDNPVSDLSIPTLQKLYSGRVRSWSEVSAVSENGLGPVEVWTYSDDSEIRMIFDASVGADQEALTGRARLAPDPAAMLEGVSSNPGAIGILPAAWLTEEVRAIRLSQTLRASLRQPVVAFSSGQPGGALKSLLLCMQEGTGHQKLMQVYDPWEDPGG